MRGYLRIGAVFIGSLCVSPAFSEHAPSYVIPSRPGVPIMINGVDASYAVVEGDWGLSRPGAVPQTVILPCRLCETSVYAPYGYRRGYFPATGRRPRIGRLEVVPRHRVLPPPAETYSRSWSAVPEPPAEPPPVIYGPRGRRDHLQSLD